MSSFEERRELWRGRLAEQKSSGVSVATFCQERSIAVSTFAYWRRRLRSEDAAPAGWLALTSDHARTSPTTPFAAAPITLRVGSVSVDVAAGFDRQLLGEVLGVLEARCEREMRC